MFFSFVLGLVDCEVIKGAGGNLQDLDEVDEFDSDAKNTEDAKDVE